MITLHTSPTATLGHNANGGLNVYVRELCTEQRPNAIVGALRVPDQHARVEERGPLARGETVGPLEVQEVPVISLGQPLLSAPERPLRPSVVALDGL